MASQPGTFNLQELADAGAPLVGGRLYTYAYGTTTFSTAYTDAAGTVPHTYTADGAGGQYIALNARGELPAPLYLASGSYDLALKRADGSTVWTRRADGQATASDVTGLAASGGSALVGFLQAGSGAVSRTAQDKLRETVSVRDFDAVGDGVTDDTAALQAAAAYCRTTQKRLYIPRGTYVVSGSIDVAGCDIYGDLAGYLNQQGTVLRCTATTVTPLVQVENTAALATVQLRNLLVTGAAVGVQLTYTLHSFIESVFVKDSLAGFQLGNGALSGPLFVTMKNCETSNISNVALQVLGSGFDNANVFEACFFSGNTYAASIDCIGGIGAVDNTFIACEFAGANYGIALGLTKNTVFRECYFESAGPSVLINGYSPSVVVDACVFGTLTNTNPTGLNYFIYHNTASSAGVSVRNGYIYLPAGAANNNLTLVGSSNPSVLTLSIPEFPSLEVGATGFNFLAPGLVSANSAYSLTNVFTPTWTSSISNPAIGDGTLTGNYVRSGNQITASIHMLAGSATTFGSGAWTFTLPFSSPITAVGNVYVKKAGVGYTQCVALASNGFLTAYVSGTGNLLSETAPITFAPGDEVFITVTYQA